MNNNSNHAGEKLVGPQADHSKPLCGACPSLVCNTHSLCVVINFHDVDEFASSCARSLDGLRHVDLVRNWRLIELLSAQVRLRFVNLPIKYMSTVPCILQPKSSRR
jgi:hypothetical protein